MASSSALRQEQVRAYGARFVPVQGSRTDATELAIAASEQSYYAGHAWDPFFIEGVKTIAYEIADQLADDPPARVIFPLGQGTLLLGLLRGFSELAEAGILKRKPRLIAVQTDACAPVHAMIRDGLTSLPMLSRPACVVADGIAVAAPVRWRELVGLARAGAVSIVSAPDAAIPTAMRRLGASGLYVEPTSAIVLAAYEHALTSSVRDGATVLVLTSSGLKANAATAAAR
jgi:threonine synthase